MADKHDIETAETPQGNRFENVSQPGTEPVEKRALRWLLSDDTGVSSKTLCSHMLGLAYHSPSSPHDAADRGRCIRLLNLIPEWWDRLDEMAAYPSVEFINFTKNGMETRKRGWGEQVPLIKEEAGRLPEALSNNDASGVEEVA